MTQDSPATGPPDIPAEFSARWAAIRAVEEKLQQAIELGETDALHQAASTRRETIASLFAELAATPELAEARLSMIEQLQLNNDRLLALAKSKIDATVTTSKELRNNRKALQAYNANG